MPANTKCDRLMFPDPKDVGKPGCNQRIKQLEAELQAAQERVKALIKRYDHSDEPCEGECVPDRNRVAADLGTIFVAQRIEEPGE